jgi:UDP-N-acetylmuramate dehydrogenase
LISDDRLSLRFGADSVEIHHPAGPFESPIDRVESALSAEIRGRIALDEPVARHTSFNIGGPADLWIEPADLADLSAALRILTAHECPVTSLGSGTNCLVSDAGIRGAVVCTVRSLKQVVIAGSRVRAEAGVSMPKLSQQVARVELAGYEWACGIPGSVGGSIVMNAGAHGGDTAGCLDEVQVVRPDGEAAWLPASELNFGYRRSTLPGSGLIVAAGRFLFQPENPEIVRSRMRDFQEKRRAAQPETSQCAGSIFKNPPAGSAGHLLESLGCKGLRQGGAEISPRHANFIVNNGGATAQDVVALIREAQRRARVERGVDLRPEVLLLGDWDDLDRSDLAKPNQYVDGGTEDDCG